MACAVTSFWSASIAPHPLEESLELHAVAAAQFGLGGHAAQWFNPHFSFVTFRHPAANKSAGQPDRSGRVMSTPFMEPPHPWRYSFTQWSVGGPRYPAPRWRGGAAEAREVGAALARMRRRAGMTQAELANLMGTTQSAVSRAETGGRMPSVGFMERYAWAAGRMLSMDIGPPARQRGIRWVSASRGTPIAPGDVVEARAEAAQRIRDTRERVDRGEISVAEYAMERLAAELELAEKQEAPI